VLPDGRLVITYDEQPARVPLITFPGGQMDEGEAPEETARRELAEETGYHAKELEYWYGFQPSTKVDYAVYVFIGRGCENGQPTHFDAGERITTKIVTLDEAIELSQEPNFQNQDLTLMFLRAKHDPHARKELEAKLFSS
jgi:8-oxo-dGTP pyrophosphatase MutT (NUDIX family)